MKASSAIPSSDQTEGITTSKKSICTKSSALYHVHIRSGTQWRWQSSGRASPIASVSVPTSIALVSLIPPLIIRFLVSAPAFLTFWWLRTYTHTHTHIYIYIHIHTNMYAVFSYVCTYVCMYACMHACMHACVYVYIYIYILMYTQCTQANSLWLWPWALPSLARQRRPDPLRPLLLESLLDQGCCFVQAATSCLQEYAAKRFLDRCCLVLSVELWSVLQ